MTPTHMRFAAVGFVLALAIAGLATSGPATAEPIAAAEQSAVAAPFDIVAADVTIGTRWLTFSLTLRGEAGAQRPEAVGSLAGAPVDAYAWPIDMDPAMVGFPADSGQLAFVVTSHPDFDDTPLFDENRDGNWDNDGRIWHSHWVVLTEDGRCAAGLKVRDIGDTDPAFMPATWPDMPIYLSSPGYTPNRSGDTLAVRVPFATPDAHTNVSFDGVTAALQVNPQLEEPLLCLTEVYDIASGDLSLPGRVGWPADEE